MFPSQKTAFPATDGEAIIDTDAPTTIDVSPSLLKLAAILVGLTCLVGLTWK